MSEIAEEIKEALDMQKGTILSNPNEHRKWGNLININAPTWLRTLLEENELLRQSKADVEHNRNLLSKEKQELIEVNERLTAELEEEKRHAETEREQANKWLEENGRLRAELDRVKSHGPEGRNYTNAEYVSLLQERESLRTELAEKDKVLEWIRDAGTDYQSIQKASEVLFQYMKGESQSEDA